MFKLDICRTTVPLHAATEFRGLKWVGELKMGGGGGLKMGRHSGGCRGGLKPITG